MDRDDVKVPLEDFVTAIADRAARIVIKEHLELCEARKAMGEHEKRLALIEKKFIALIAFMVGAGGLGGLIGAYAGKVLGF